MASRRLAISSLLCVDDPSASQVAGPSYSASVDTASSRPVAVSPVRYAAHEERAMHTDHLVESDPSRFDDVVPLSFQPALHLRRRTPPPSASSHASPAGSSVRRRSFKEIAFDDYQGHPVGMVSSLTTILPQDHTERSPRRPSARSDSPPVNGARGSLYTVAHSPPHPRAAPEPPLLPQHPRRLSSGEHAEQSRSPRHSASSIRSLMNSPPRSSVGLYTPQQRPSSWSDAMMSSPTQNSQASVPLPALRPSTSPIQSLHRSSHSSTVSPTHLSPNASSPPLSSSSQRPQSRHAIASLLTESPSVPRASAASLPHILNSPTQSRSSASTAIPSSVQGAGMHGLEALVQAASQERRRLSGEVKGEGIVPAVHLVSTDSRAVSAVERGEGTIRRSPFSERDSARVERRSPVVDGARTIRAKSPPAQQPPLSPSSPLRSASLPSPVRAMPAPLPMTRALDISRTQAQLLPGRAVPYRSHSPPFDGREGEPPTKRRRGSDGPVSTPHSPSPAPPTIIPPVKDAQRVPLGPDVRVSLLPSSAAPSSKRSDSSTPIADSRGPGSTSVVVELKAEELPLTIDLPNSSQSAKKPPTSRIQSPSESRKPHSGSAHSSQRPSHMTVEPSSKSGSPDKEAPRSRQDDGIRKKDEAEGSVSAKKTKGEAKHGSKDKPVKSRRHEHAPSSQTDVQPSVKRKASSEEEDDPYDWLMEHYGGASASRTSHDHGASQRHITHNSNTATVARPSVLSTKKPSREGKRSRAPSRTQSPAPAAMLEEDISAVAEDRHPRAATKLHRGPAHNQSGGKSVPDVDMDLDAELDLVAGPRGTDLDTTHRPGDALDMDVEDELLSLVDDNPWPRRASPHVHSQPEVPRTSPSPSSTKPLNGHSSTSSSKPKTITKPLTKSDRESMPPPQTPDLAQPHDDPTSSKKGEASTSASTKKKDGTTKSAAKKQVTAAKPKMTKSSSAPKVTGKGSSQVKDGSSTPAPSTSNTTLAVPTTGSGGKAKKTSPHPSGTALGAGVAAKRAVSTAGGGAASRSRSTSVMPGSHDTDKAADKKTNEESEEDPVVDDKLYCICKTKYDEDRVMIACDRCDEWYHTQCVNMPDLEVDLVDQFICPTCIAENPQLTLKTTYKRRCHSGLQHPHPTSSSACHKPARGAVSKYCSDECAVKFMQTKIRRWGGDKASLWEGVKDADKREAVVVRCIMDDEHGDKPHKDGVVDTRVEVVKPTKSKAQRELDRLNSLLSRLPVRRDALKKEEEILIWRDGLVQLAVARADMTGECGWDQRLCFGDDEVVEFGSEVLQSYVTIKDEGGEDPMQVDGSGEWWCRGKKKCDRHAGWQKLRQAEIDLEKELLNANLDKITAEERDLRSRIEDVLTESDVNSTFSRKPTQSVAGMGPLKAMNGDGASTAEVNGTNGTKAQVNGIDQGVKKGKKRKPE